MQIRAAPLAPRHTRKAVITRVFAMLWVLSWTLPAMASGTAPALRVLAWPGYADEDVVRVFEQQSGRRVQVTYVTSDDELWQKTGTSPGEFDVFAVNTAELQRYLIATRLLPIDLTQIPNQSRQLVRFQTLTQSQLLRKNNQVYAIPYTYSEMGLIYNPDIVTAPPTSIAALWDPRYRGQVLAFDASNHNFSIAAQALGFPDPFHLDESQMAAAAIKLIDLRRNLFALYSDPDEVIQLYRETGIALIYANYGTQQVSKLRQAGFNIGYVIPAEGAFAWLDCWVITREARDVALAHAWINYMLEPQVGQILTERQGLANTLSTPAGQRESDRILWLEPLAKPQQRSALWERIRAGEPPEHFR